MPGTGKKPPPPTPEEILNEKFRMLSTFARGTAHDLNNILTSIAGNISLAMVYTDSDPAGVKKKLEDAEAALERAKEFTSNLVEMTKTTPAPKMETSISTLLKSITSNL
ncbi:MAG: histidine kinase dimerization/phospho-acceptor domain-containing protein, partial [Thermodesulfobacteriota bacterium]